jgi:hypothetical protein
MIYWRFKNHNATFAFRRFTIRLTSTFICFTKTRITWKLVFMSTLDCTSIIDRWITSSTTYARFASRWRIINESMCTMFIMFHSIFTRREARWQSQRLSKAVSTTTKSTFYWKILICIILYEATRQNRFNMTRRISFWTSLNRRNFDSFFSQTLSSEKRVILKTRSIWFLWRKSYKRNLYTAWRDRKWIKAQIIFRFSQSWW